MFSDAEISRMSTRLIFRLAEEEHSKKLNENEWRDIGPSDEKNLPATDGYRRWQNTKDNEIRIQIRKPGGDGDTEEKEPEKEQTTPEAVVPPENDIHQQIHKIDGYEGRKDEHGRNIGIHQRDNDDGSISVRIYDDNGNMESDGRLNGGALDGQQKWFHGDGKLKYQGTYIDGLAEGNHSQYDETGFLVNEVKYFDGKLHGKSTKYNEDGSHFGVFYDQGTKVFESNYGKNGKLTGDAKWYNPDGSVAFSCRYKNGLMDGLATWYNDKGEVAAEATFKDGQNVKTGLNSKNKEVDITEKMDDEVKAVHEILSSYVNKDLNETVPVGMAKGLAKVIGLKGFKDTSVSRVRENLKKYFDSKDMQEYDEFLNRVDDADLRTIIEGLRIVPIEKISPAEFQEALKHKEPAKSVVDNGAGPINTVSPDVGLSAPEGSVDIQDPDQDPRYVKAVKKWEDARDAHEYATTKGAPPDILGITYNEQEKARKEASAIYDLVLKEMAPADSKKIDKPIEPSVALPDAAGKTLADPPDGSVDFGDEGGGKSKKDNVPNPTQEPVVAPYSDISKDTRYRDAVKKWEDANTLAMRLEVQTYSDKSPEKKKELEAAKAALGRAGEEMSAIADKVRAEMAVPTPAPVEAPSVHYTQEPQYIEAIKKWEELRDSWKKMPEATLEERVLKNKYYADFVKPAANKWEEIAKQFEAKDKVTPVTPSPEKQPEEKLPHHKIEYGHLPEEKRKKIDAIKDEADKSLKTYLDILKALKANREKEAANPTHYNELFKIDNQILHSTESVEYISNKAASEMNEEINRKDVSPSPIIPDSTPNKTPTKYPAVPSGIAPHHDIENKKMIHHRNEFGNIPVERKNRIKEIRNRADASISPKRDRLQKLKAKRATAPPNEWSGMDKTIEEENSIIKGLAMSAAAEIRKEVQGDLLVTVPGGLTDKELESKIQDMRKFSNGTDVVFTDKDGKKQNGKVISHTYGGKFKVLYGDSGISLILSGDEISHAVPVEDRIAESRKIHERREGANRDKNIEEDLKAIDGSPSPLHAKEIMKKLWDTDEENLPQQIKERLKQKEENPGLRDFSQTPPGKNINKNKKHDEELRQMKSEKMERYKVLINKENKSEAERQEAATLYEDIGIIDNLLKGKTASAKKFNKKGNRRASVGNDIYSDLAIHLIAERIEE